MAILRQLQSETKMVRRILSRRDVIASTGVAIGGILLWSRAWALPCWGCRKPALDMPVSLEIGTIRTPAFAVKHEPYVISIQAKRSLPFADMNCMMGLPWGSTNPTSCQKGSLLQADWIVFDEGQKVARGSIGRKQGKGASSDRFLERYLGYFVGEKERHYVLEVNFITDGTALDVTEPHLVVTMRKPTDF